RSSTAYLRSGRSPPSRSSTLSLHDALPISGRAVFRGVAHGWNRRMVRNELSRRACRLLGLGHCRSPGPRCGAVLAIDNVQDKERSEEHTSELQSLAYLVCRLLLEKKKPLRA